MSMVRRRRCAVLSLLVAHLVATATAVESTTSLVFNWYSCSFYTAEDKAHDDPNAIKAQCADVAMPLCYPSVCDSNRTIVVFVKRLLATKQPADKISRALWMVQGGPGYGSPGLEPGLLDAYNAFNQTLSVYTIDNRGTGRSTILACPPTNSKLNDQQNLAYCLASLKTQYGSVAPQSFSVTSAALDIAGVINSPLFTSSDVFVYGVSYGTYTVERLMHLAPPAVKGYILDSVQSEEFDVTKDAPYYSNWDRDVGDAADQFLTYCDNDAYCSARLGPSAKKTLLDVYAALNATTSPCWSVLNTKAKAAGVATALEYVGGNLYNMLGSKEQWSLIAPYIYRIHRCSKDDIAMFSKISTKLTSRRRFKGAYLKDEGYSDVLYNNIVYNELWELPSPTIDMMAAQSKAALFGSKDTRGLASQFKEFCIYRDNTDPVCKGYPTYDGAGFVYKRDQYWNKSAAIPPDSSVLLLSGLLDPATPHKYAKDQYETMQGSNKLLLQFPYGGHGTLGTAPLEDNPKVDCANEIFYQYLHNRGNVESLDASCIAKVQKINFSNVTDPEDAIKIFGTADNVWGPDSPSLPPVPATPSTTAPLSTLSGAPNPTTTAATPTNTSPALISKSFQVFALLVVMW
ncbi:hypothetical protein AC1031_018328 [Aphanomyces cochlioides]|nr:hypothetical protein AC1031_018328 [Aphanomyces cochlioides]